MFYLTPTALFGSLLHINIGLICAPVLGNPIRCSVIFKSETGVGSIVNLKGKILYVVERKDDYETSFEGYE
jgi:hypothetical protein